MTQEISEHVHTSFESQNLPSDVPMDTIPFTSSDYPTDSTHDEERIFLTPQNSENDSKTRNMTTIFAILLISVMLIVVFGILQVQHDNPGYKPKDPTNINPQPEDLSLQALHGMVATDTPLCSQIGSKILSDHNGNAVDSAVAVSICLTLARPHSAGIGGGGVMLIHLENGTKVVIDSREVAPAAANSTMYEGNPQGSLFGPLAVAVPGELKGLEYAFHNFGSGNLTWAEIIQPTIDLGNSGIPIDKAIHDAIVTMLPVAQAESSDIYDEWINIFAPLSGSPPENTPIPIGSKYYWPKLVNTLSIIASNGTDTLYSSANGSLGAQIVADMAAHGGIFNGSDFEDYAIKVTEPLVGFYHGKTILTSPPPFSGAVALLAYNILEGFNLPALTEKGTKNLGLAYHLVTEAWKYAYSDRMALTDPDFQANVSTVIIPTMLSKAHAGKLRSGISLDTTYPVPHYEDLVDLTEPNRVAGTSHYSVVDSKGNVVATTTTVNLYFGSMWISPSTGILFNDEMDDFSQPGQSNAFGLPPSIANYIVPGKRPVSSQTPTIILDGNQPILAIGASGGSRIITSTMLTAIRYLDFDQSLWKSIDDPRIHHQLLPDYIKANSEFPYIDYLESKGHLVVEYAPSDHPSIVQGIAIDPITKILTGVSDPRKGGAPAGY